MSRWTFCALIAALTLTASASAAEGPALDTLRFRAAPLPGDILGVGAATAHDAGVLRGMFSLQGEHNPIFLVTDPDRVEPIVSDRMIGEVAMSFGLGKGISLWSGLPMVMYQSGWWPEQSEDIHSWGLGDLRFGASFPVIDPLKHPVGVAIRPGVQVPTGVRNAFASSGVVELHSAVGVETRRLGPVRLASSLGARIGPPSDWVDVEVYSAFTYGLGVDVQVHERWTVDVAWLGEVAGNNWENPMEIRVGGSFVPTDGITLGTCMGWGVAPGAGTPDFRLGFQITMGGPVHKKTPEIEVVERVPPEPVGPVLAPAMVDATAALAESPTGYVEILMPTPVIFREGETRLSKEAAAALESVVDYLATHPEMRPIVVLGHGDETGGDEYNTVLSRRRAISTRKYLVDEGGIAPEHLSVPEESPLQAPLDVRTGRRSAVGFVLSSGS
jgi:hypothetical protein